MLITKRGEKQHDYRKFRCRRCGSEFICDSKDINCASSNYDLFVACPVCGDFLSYEKHGLGYVSTEEYNKIKSQYEQME